MKVAVDLQALQSEHSRNRGIGRYTRALLEVLLEIPGPIEYVLYANGSLPDPNLSDRWRPLVRNIPFLENDHFSGVNEALLKTVLLAEEVDVVFLPSPMEMDPTVTLPDFGRFPAAICTICYDLIPLLYPDWYLVNGGSRRKYHERLRNIRHSDKVLCISECTRRDTVRLLDVPSERTLYIGAGVGPEFQPLPANERESWRERFRAKWGLRLPFIMYTGGGDRRKNLEGLVTASARLPEFFQGHYQVVIACHLDSRAELKLHEEARAAGMPPDSLVLTNYVTDEELIALYSLCELFVFPSHYEGFGLPLVEAMGCGAPAVASNNSSLVEIVSDPSLLFDSSDPDSIASRIKFVLADEELRSKIAMGASEAARRFTWQAAAEATHQALLSCPPRYNRKTVTFDRPHDKMAPGKKRLAFFSPFRPLQSGISDYSEELLPHITQYYESDLYVDTGYAPTLETATTPHPIFPYSFFERSVRKRGLDYRTLLYQMGNHGVHAFLYAHLMRFAGITVLHDYNLCGLIAWTEERRSEWGITLASELLHECGPEHSRAIVDDLRIGKLTAADLPGKDIYVNRRIFTRSLGVIVHNRWSYDKSVSKHSDVCDYIALIPHPIPRVPMIDDPAGRRRLKRQRSIPVDAFVFVSAGLVTPTKRPLALLDAFRIYLATHPEAFLVFVGGLEMPLDFPAEIARRGLTNNVKVTGHVDGMETFYEYLRLADVTITLRYPSNGETSGALLRMLAHGKPTIVSDIGSFAEYPSDIVHKVSTPDRGNEVAEIVQAMALLTDDASYRERLGANALDYVRREHSPEHCARLYSEFIEQVMSDPRTRMRLLADYAGREAARALRGAFDPSDTEANPVDFRGLLTPFAEAVASSGGAGS